MGADNASRYQLPRSRRAGLQPAALNNSSSTNARVRANRCGELALVLRIMCCLCNHTVTHMITSPSKPTNTKTVMFSKLILNFFNFIIILFSVLFCAWFWSLSKHQLCVMCLCVYVQYPFCLSHLIMCHWWWLVQNCSKILWRFKFTNHSFCNPRIT